MSSCVLVTGASSGIGAAATRRLAAAGMRVFGTSRVPRDPGPDENGIEWLTLDVCDDASVEQAFKDLARRAPALDGLVCNAGWGLFGSVEEVSLEAARAQFETNYFGVLRSVRAALPAMRERAGGRIVLVGSLAGRSPIPFQSHYSSTKAAVDALALALRNELHATGVHVSLVEPGDIDTPFNEATDFGDRAGSPYEAALARSEAVIRESLPKAPKPDVVAKAIEHALTARRPRVRYAVGANSLQVPIARRFLPDWLSLRFIRGHYDL